MEGRRTLAGCNGAQVLKLPQLGESPSMGRPKSGTGTLESAAEHESGPEQESNSTASHCSSLPPAAVRTAPVRSLAACRFRGLVCPGNTACAGPAKKF